MIDALFNQPTYVAAKKMLDATVLRQEAIASNLSNLETPNYKRLDVAPTFEAQLSQAVKNGDATQMAGLQPSLAVDRSAVSGLIDGNTVTANLSRGIDISNAGAHQVLNNVATANYGSGIYIRENANGNLISNNFVSGSLAKPGENGYGILLYNCQGNTVNANILTGNAGLGLRDAYPSGGGTNNLSDNVQSGNGNH